MQRAVIFYGPPGSGKGTQAETLANEKGFTHFDSGKFLEALVNAPEHKDDPVMQYEKNNFDTGKLMTPAFVLKYATAEAYKKFKNGESIVYSGSPRTLYEAFGDENATGLYQTLEETYGKENIHVIYIDVSPETSVERNSARGRKNLDDPEVIRIRLVEYKNRTKPIFEKLKERGYKIIEINGEEDISTVGENILRQLDL